MAEFPDARAGDVITVDMYNSILRELRRWQKFSVAPPLAIANVTGDAPPVIWLADQPPFYIKLTSTYASGYAWTMVYIDGPPYAVVLAGVSGGPATGDPAFERQNNDTTLTVDGTVYEASYSAGGGITFDGKN